MLDRTWSGGCQAHSGRAAASVKLVAFAGTTRAGTAFVCGGTAALDRGGHLHVAWYDSAGPSGVLLYTRSRGTAPFANEFLDPIVIDPNATPEDGWYPDTDLDSGGRRLHEYFGLAVDGDGVHLASTHSPAAPSRVYTVAVQADLLPEN